MKHIFKVSVIGISLLGVISTGCSSSSGQVEQDFSSYLNPLMGSSEDSRSGHSLVSTDSSVVLWGGRLGSQDSAFNDGYSYVRSGEREPLPDHEIRPRSDHVSIWTGDELVVWGGFLGEFDGASGGRLASDGFALDVERQTWREISEAPEGRVNATAGFFGEFLVIAGGIGPEGPSESILFYSPSEDSWETLSLDFVVHSMEELPSGDIAVFGITANEGIRTGVVSLSDRTVQEVEVSEFVGADVSAYASTVTMEGDVVVITEGAQSFLYFLDGELAIRNEIPLNGSAIYGLVDNVQAPLNVGNLQEFEQGSFVSIADAGVTFIESSSGGVSNYPADEIDGHCGEGVKSVAFDGKIFAIGGVGCGVDSDFSGFTVG